MMQKTEAAEGVLFAVVIASIVGVSTVKQGLTAFGNSAMTTILGAALIIGSAVVIWDSIPDTLYAVATFIHEKVHDWDERVALLLKICVGGPLAIYVFTCTITLYLFVIPNVLMSQMIIEKLNLAGEAFITVVGVNLLTGLVGSKLIR